MSDSDSSESPLEKLLQKHRKEKKDLIAKVQILKKSKGDKKKKKEVTEEIAQLESELSTRHAQELAKFNSVKDDENSSTVESSKPEDDGGVDNVTESLQNTKLGKAQRRREKKEHEAREREERIKEQEKENVHGVRNKETEAIKKILKRHELMIHEIPSDGNCLYAAILHQMPVCSLSELRQRVAHTMLEDPTEYLPYLTSKKTEGMMPLEEFEEYCNNLANTSAWGGQVEVRALTQVLKASIRIVQASGPAILLGEEFTGIKPVTLCYHRHMYKLGAHYNSVKPLVKEDEEEDGGGEFVEPK
uniref:OTU domain-containing protein 6B n=2 Tax=Cacopsylla melanoneura TaxID=428564 RepID=A0A8D8USL4_9HEMI